MSERDSLLERLLSGETNAADPAVQRLFERDPAARAEYEALRALESSLERQGDRAREVVEAAQHLPDRVGSQQVLATLTRLAEQGPGAALRPTATRRRLGPAWLAVAALVVAVLAWRWWSHSNQTQREILLGPDTPAGAALAPISPVGPVKEYPPFTWSSELQPGGWFEIAVYDADRPGSDPFLESGTVLENRWSPDASQLGSPWPARIRWTVTRTDRAGIPGPPESAEAWRLP
jgi:hypothetical protein